MPAGVRKGQCPLDSCRLCKSGRNFFLRSAPSFSTLDSHLDLIGSRASKKQQNMSENPDIIPMFQGARWEKVLHDPLKPRIMKHAMG